MNPRDDRGTFVREASGREKYDIGSVQERLAHAIVRPAVPYTRAVNHGPLELAPGQARCGDCSVAIELRTLRVNVEMPQTFSSSPAFRWI